MSETARILLMLALGGAGVTFLGSGALWLMDPQRRMQRALRKVLSGWPDALLLSPSTGRGAAFAFDAGKLAVCWNNGAWCLIYRIEELAGTELIVDGQVVGRALRGEPSRVLDRANGAAENVVLRLIFDDPRHPDFDIALWASADQLRRVAASPAEAIAEANSWLARTEAILRRPRTTPAQAAVAALPDYDDEEDEPDEAEPRPASPPGPATKPSRRTADDEDDPELPF